MTNKAVVKQLWCSSLGLVFALAMTAANAGASSSLQGLWHLDTVSSFTTPDSSGNANNGTICINTSVPDTCATLTGGKFSNSLRFDGSDDAVVVPDSGSLQVTGNLTVEAWIWINPSANLANNLDIVAKFNDGAGGSPSEAYLLNIFEDTVAFSVSQDGSTYDYINGGTLVSAGRWHHVAGVYLLSDLNFGGSPSLSVYLDGVLDGSKATTVASISPATGTPVSFGSHNHSAVSNVYVQPFWGNIDEVRIWSRGLINTPLLGEILASAQSGLRGDWHFDTSVSGVTPDSSGYSNNATLTGSVLGGSGPEPWFGKSLPLNGTTNLATVADNSTVEISGSLSLDAWINPSTVSPEFQIVAARVNDGGNIAYGLYLDGSAICMEYFDDFGGISFPCGGTVTATGTWQHVAGVIDFNAGMVYVYLNGIQVASGATTPHPVSLAAGVPLLIGAQGVSAGGEEDFFQGSIDEVHLWARALSAQEVGFLSGNCTPTPPIHPLDSLGACAAELVVPVDMTQQIDSDAEVFPETYFQYAATSEAPPVKPLSKPKPGGLGPEHAMPLWFMVSDSDITAVSPLNPCAIDIGSTPGDPKNQIGGLLGCQGSADGKSALLSGVQINVQTAAKKPMQPATTLHVEVTTSDSDKLPVNFQWR